MGSNSSMPSSVSAEIDVDQVERFSHTQGFDVPEFLVTRRDTTFPITLRTGSRLTLHSVTLDYEEGKQIQLEVLDTSARVYATIIKVSNVCTCTSCTAAASDTHTAFCRLHGCAKVA